MNDITKKLTQISFELLNDKISKYYCEEADLLMKAIHTFIAYGQDEMPKNNDSSLASEITIPHLLIKNYIDNMREELYAKELTPYNPDSYSSGYKYGYLIGQLESLNKINYFINGNLDGEQ